LSRKRKAIIFVHKLDSTSPARICLYHRNSTYSPPKPWQVTTPRLILKTLPHHREGEHVQAMTKEEARAIMKAHRWTYQERSPRQHELYIYARRKQRGKIVERYICPLSRLEELTEAELIAKLVQPLAEKS